MYLEETPKAYLQNAKIETKCDGTVRIAVEIQSPDEREKQLTAAFDGQEHTAALTLAPGLNCAELTFQVENPKLWTPDEPNLYEGELRLRRRTAMQHLFRPARDQLFLLRRAQVPVDYIKRQAGLSQRHARPVLQS